MDSHRSASLAEELGGEREGDVDSVRKVVTASVIGTAIEWYDFFLYATAAALVFNELFFPSSEPLTGTLAAFATYAVGFAVRPIGGIVFGHLGDRIGRKAVLVSTLLLMGTSTFLIGCLPTFDAIGVWAPVLLVLLRMVQGFGAGAEFDGRDPDGRRAHAGAQAGLLRQLAADGRGAGADRRHRHVRPRRDPARRSAQQLGLADPLPAERGDRRRRPLHPAAVARDSGLQGAQGPARGRQGAPCWRSSGPPRRACSPSWARASPTTRCCYVGERLRARLRRRGPRAAQDGGPVRRADRRRRSRSC